MSTNLCLKPTYFLLFWLIISFSLSFGGCSDVGTAHRIDSGIDPVYEDDEVRFRTTYYLRVFDLCPVERENLSKKNNLSDYENRPLKPGSSSNDPQSSSLTARKSGALRIVKDSLHRFRMTGKASALFNNLHFESGVLTKDELEPFGKTIKYSPESKKFQGSDSHSNSGELKPPNARDQSEKNNCPDGEPTQQRFFLIGPEGTKELERHDRLVMAMYTDAEPLISALKHLAGQKSNEDSKILLPMDIEQHKVRGAKALELINASLKKETIPSLQEEASPILQLFETNIPSKNFLRNIQKIEIPKIQDMKGGNQ